MPIKNMPIIKFQIHSCRGNIVEINEQIRAP